MDADKLINPIVVKNPSDKLLNLIKDCRDHKHEIRKKIRSSEQYSVQVPLQ